MAPKKYVNILRKYLDGEISFKQLCAIVDDRLFEIRVKSPQTSKESEFLSGIELICEEIKDGFRTQDELNEYIKNALAPAKPVSP